MNWLEQKIARKIVIDHLKAFWATYGTLLGGAFYYLLPGLQAIANAHPKSTFGVLLGWAIIAFHSTSPSDRAKQP